MIEHNALAGATVDAASAIPLPHRESHRLGRGFLWETLSRVAEKDRARFGIGIGLQLALKVRLEDGYRDVGCTEPFGIPPESIEIPPPALTVSSREQNGPVAL